MGHKSAGGSAAVIGCVVVTLVASGAFALQKSAVALAVSLAAGTCLALISAELMRSRDQKPGRRRLVLMIGEGVLVLLVAAIIVLLPAKGLPGHL